MVKKMRLSTVMTVLFERPTKRLRQLYELKHDIESYTNVYRNHTKLTSKDLTYILYAYMLISKRIFIYSPQTLLLFHVFIILLVLALGNLYNA